jgi:uncharacterized membrane protein
MGSDVLEFAVIVYQHTGGAEQAYSRAPSEVDGVAWAQEIAFVEHHRHDRLLVRGTFAGHYVDADDAQELLGRGTAEGAIAGGAVGLLFGPAGLAVGIVGGGMTGSLAQEHPETRLRSAFFNELRSEVPEGSSALVMMAAPEHVDAMVAAVEGSNGRVVRHQLTPEAAAALRDAVADSPEAAPPPAG